MIMQGCVISCGTVVFFQKSRNLSRSLLTNNNFYCVLSRKKSKMGDIPNSYVTRHMSKLILAATQRTFSWSLLLKKSTKTTHIKLFNTILDLYRNM